MDIMLLEAPRKEDLLRRPRLADKAAPAAICCFLDFAGMLSFTAQRLVAQRGLSRAGNERVAG